METTEQAFRRLMLETSVPAKRRNKQISGRQGRKQYQSRAAVRRAGGTSDLLGAMLEGPEGVFRDLCFTVPKSTGFDKEGRPYRSPNEGRRSSGAQRGQ